MSRIPHPDSTAIAISCAVVTISDSRSVETDSSGRVIQESLTRAGHRIGFYRIIADDPGQIQALLSEIGDRGDIEAIVLNGGTGIAPRDTTYDALVSLLEKTLPGFGEVFRALSYAEIGSRAIASRAIAGIYRGMVVFSLPGSTNAVKLGLEKLILPEIQHLVGQMRG
jgi:molybdopterin adenylyltransferase